MKKCFFKKILCLAFIVMLSTNAYADVSVVSFNDGEYGYSATVDMSKLNIEQAKATVLQQTYKLCQYCANNLQVDKQMSIIFKLNDEGFMGVLVLPSLLDEVLKSIDEEAFYKKLIDSKLIALYRDIKKIN